MRSCLRNAFYGLFAALCLLLSACEPAEVTVYEVPKEESSNRLASASGGPEIPAEDGEVLWQAPDHWQTLAPTAFRKGNYLYTSNSGGRVEITVSSFPGDVGGLLANVNRWLGQAGLDPIDQAQLMELVEPGNVKGRPVVTVDLKADNPTPDSDRIYASVVEFGGESWFFKMTGPHEAVESQIPAFNDMVQDLQFVTGAEATSKAPPAPSAETEIVFDPPVGWIESVGSPLRVASYSIDKDGLPPADFSITTFPGDTGGTVANVNRWRRQIGLEPWTADQVAANRETLENEAGHTFDIFDLKAISASDPEENTDRILAAVLERDGRSWFFKLRGDALLLETQRSKFRSLLQSVRFTQDAPAAQ